MAQQIYRTILEDIKQKINTGVLQGGDRLPTELELKEHYHTSKTTVRKALKVLSDEGYIHTIHRIGNFINIPNNKDYILYFDETDIKFGIEHVNVFSIDIVTDLSKLFQGCPEKKALEIKSLFQSAEIPVGFDKKYIIYNKGINLHSKAFDYNDILEILSKQIMLYQLDKELVITGVKASKEIADHLNIKENDYVIRVAHRYFDQYKKNIAYCETYYRPDYIKLFAKSL